VATSSIALEGPDGETYVLSHDFPNPMRAGDTFAHDGLTWQVLEVAMKQFDAPGEPPETLR
jgi:hypothetical protein